MQDGTFLEVIFWIFLSIAFFIILTLPPQTDEITEKNVDSHKCDSQNCEIKNQNMTNNNWLWTNNHCLKKIHFKNGSIMQIPRCEF